MKRLLSAALCFLLLSCQPDKPTDKVSHESTTPQLRSIEPLTFKSNWHKKYWIDKVARVLRDGRAIGPKDDLAGLMKMNSVEIVDKFLADPAFTDTVLDFNLYFLGRKLDYLRFSRGPGDNFRYFNDLIFSYPQAISSAREVAKNGNFLKLFEFDQPMYVQLHPINPNTPKRGADGSLAPPQILTRAYLAMELSKYFEELITTLSSPHDKAALCKGLGDTIQTKISSLNLGINTDFFITITSRSPFIGSFGYCTSPSSTPDNFILSLKRMNAGIQAFAAELDRLESLKLSEKIEDLPQIDVSSIVDFKTEAFGFFFWLDQQNSSTNSNRKRGAYILKQFFCDDLTPVGVAIPSEHAIGGAHGSETSCYACHYKLDPISGFFRDRGVFGHDFSYNPFIVFDDQAALPREEYQKQWLSPANSTNRWNVGYVRTLQFPQKNEYGESLRDLFKIIQNAPEVKQCLIRKLYQFTVGEGQVFDKGYLELATDEFVKASAENSTIALKTAFKRALHSNIFSHMNPESDQCYDYGPGDSGANKPPCRVSYLLEKNCAGCHQGESANKSLDLTRWIDTGNGQMGFSHLDKDGKQYSPKQTFEKIIESLQTSDLNKRMPLRKYMSSQDQQAIFLWVQSMGDRK